MKWLAGVGGGLVSVAAYFLAEYASSLYSALITNPTLQIAVAVALGIVSILEIPFMTFGLRHIRKESNRTLLLSLVVGYASFGAAYAAILVLLTGQSAWGRALVALGWLRVASLLWVR